MWDDTVRLWRSGFAGANATFAHSLGILMPSVGAEDCAYLDIPGCRYPANCATFEAMGLAVSPYLVMTSLSNFKMIYRLMYDTLHSIIANSFSDIRDFERLFETKRIPSTSEWPDHLLDLIVSGPSLWASPILYLAKSLYDPHFGGTHLPKATGTFSAYMWQAMTAWQEIVETSLTNLYDGTDENINLLTSVISDGKLVLSMSERNVSLRVEHEVGGDVNTNPNWESLITQSFYSRMIAAFWNITGNHPFVLDSGYGCDKDLDTVLKVQMNREDMPYTGVCYKDKQYYMVNAQGDPVVYPFPPCYGCLPPMSHPSRFSMPLSLKSLATPYNYGDLNVEIFVAGSVNSYKANGNVNRNNKPDFHNSNGAMVKSVSQNITAPGFINLPVCNVAVARRAWNHPDTKIRKLAEYPCVQL
ncbi:hypothetical protein KEM56_002194 [Ascosphaera pollenicola]|nr:hypothetical protein KEM56_002194 [Ascosphaera pollenicola]